MSVKDPKVSVFKRITETTNGAKVSLAKVMDSIQSGYWKEKVTAYRNITDEKSQKASKRNLPYFTGSGLFKKRSDAGLLQHSNRIVIDIDNVEDVDQAKSVICSDGFVEYAFASCGGYGLAIIVKIDGSKHDESFEACFNYFKQKYQDFFTDNKKDKSSKGKLDKLADVSRPRYVSYDPDMYYNPESKVFLADKNKVDQVKEIIINMVKFAVQGECHNQLIKASYLAGGYIAGGVIDEQEITSALRLAVHYNDGYDDEVQDNKAIADGIREGRLSPIEVEELENITKNTEEQRGALRQVYIFACQANRSGRAWSETDVSKQCEKYLLNKELVEDTFRKAYDDNKDEHNIENRPPIAKVEVYLNRRYHFARNIVTGNIEMKHKKSNSFIDCNIDSIYRELQHMGFKFPLTNIKSLLESDFVKDYDPLKRYFETLDPSHPDSNAIDDLANCIKTTDQDFWIAQFKKALVRSIACVLDGKENRIVITLVGEKQNTGKSTFIRFLNPFGSHYYTESPIRDNKDSEISFSENFIYNIEELASLNNTDVNKLKAIISKNMVKERRPFARKAEEMPRRCSFWATTNRNEFLIDTENTRWLCFTVESIDWLYKQKINIHDVWAQAYELYLDPDFDDQLTVEESSHRDSINKSFEVTDIEKELIMRNFEVTRLHEGTFYPNSEILEIITEKSGGRVRLNSRMIGKSMKQLGFCNDVKKMNGHSVRGYWAEVKIVTPDEYHSHSFFASSSKDGDDVEKAAGIKQSKMSFSNDFP